MNRFVRAVLAALRDLGVDAFYPGRDRITLDRRMLGVVSLESAPSGATSFEAVLAIDGDWLRLPELVRVVDRDGVIAAEVLAADQVTTLAAHAPAPGLDDLANFVGSACAQQFGVELVAGIVPPEPADTPRSRRNAGIPPVAASSTGAASPGAARRAGGLPVGARRSHCRCTVRRRFHCRFRLDRAARAAARGCRFERAAISALVEAVYADPHSFLLGIGPLQTVVDTILSAA